MDDLVYLGFVNGTSRHTRILASATWVIYYPSVSCCFQEAFVLTLLQTMLRSILLLLTYYLKQYLLVLVH